MASTVSQQGSQDVSRLAARVPDSIVLVTFGDQREGIPRRELKTHKEALSAVRKYMHDLARIPSARIDLQVRIEGGVYCGFTGDAWTLMAQSAKDVLVKVRKPQREATRNRRLQADVEPVRFAPKGEDDNVPLPPHEVYEISSDSEEDEGRDGPPVRNDEINDAATLSVAGSQRRPAHPTQTLVRNNPQACLTLENHLQMENDWLKAHKDIAWVFPPAHLRLTLLDLLRHNRGTRQNTQKLPDDVEIAIGNRVAKRKWLNGRINKIQRIEGKEFIVNSEELYRALIDAHVSKNGNHNASTSVRKRIQEKYLLGPGRVFVVKWVAACPGC